MNKTRKLVVVNVLLLASSVGFGNEISLMQLLIEPEKHVNKKIIVKGVVDLSYEASNIYFNQWSFVYGVSSNSICLTVNTKNDYSRFNGATSIVVGEFKKNEYCGYSLHIEHISIAQKLNQTSKSKGCEAVIDGVQIDGVRD